METWWKEDNNQWDTLISGYKQDRKDRGGQVARYVKEDIESHKVDNA